MIKALGGGQPCGPGPVADARVLGQVGLGNSRCGQGPGCAGFLHSLVSRGVVPALFRFGLAFQGLLKNVQLLVKFWVDGALGADLAHRVQHRGVVAATEQFTDLGQALFGHVLGQVHGNLARASDAGRALLAVHVGDFDLVKVGHGFLDVLNTDLAVLDAQQVLQCLTRQADVDVLVAEAAVGQHFAQCAFKFAHVGAHVLGDDEDNTKLIVVAVGVNPIFSNLDNA